MNRAAVERLARECRFEDVTNGKGALWTAGIADLERFTAKVAEQCFLTVVAQAQGKTRDDELAIRRAAEAIRAEFFAALPLAGPPA